MKIFKSILIFLFCCLLTFSLNASSFSINAENDTLSFPKKDREYSHGTEFVYMSDSPFWIFDNIGFGMEQTMYTPPLLKTDDLQIGEHPYCGYLSFNLLGENWIPLTEKTTFTLQHSLGFGCVGPSSHAEQSQKIIHKWLGCKEPKGWKWQISDEAIVQYQLYANLNYEIYKKNSFQVFIIPRAGTDFGGFKDMIAIGSDIKIGWNVKENVGSNMILSAPKSKKKSKYGFFLLTGVEGRCVFHDTSIDGGLFKDSIHTEKSELLVGEFHWGVGITIKNVEIDYFQFIRSNELESNLAKDPNYGRISLTVQF